MGRTDEALSDNHLLLLATWLSPAFPVGGFSYSHGLETEIAAGRLRTADAAADWIGLLIERGSGWNDALLLAEAWRAARADDAPRLAAAAELAAALAPSRERHLETLSLGTAFLRALGAGWPNIAAASLLAALGDAVAYPVAVGAAAGVASIPLRPTLAAYLNAFAATLISAAVRLVPLGQGEGLRALAGLQPLALGVAARAAVATLDDLGSAALNADIASMRHETLYSRVYRS